MTKPTAGGGLFESSKRALDSLLELAVVRLQLFGTELEAEKLRLVASLVQAVMGLLLLVLTLALASGFVVLWFWDSHRLAAVGVLTLVHGALGCWFVLRARAGFRRPEGGAFALSVGELRRDRAGLRPHPPDGLDAPPPPRP